MYKRKTLTKTLLRGNEVTEGESIEVKVRRILKTKEPINDSSPEIFTARSEGVLPGFNIRTDRFELAADAMDKIAASELARRENMFKPKEDKPEKESKVIDLNENKNAEGEPTPGKAGNE